MWLFSAWPGWLLKHAARPESGGHRLSVENNKWRQRSKWERKNLCLLLLKRSRKTENEASFLEDRFILLLYPLLLACGSFFLSTRITNLFLLQRSSKCVSVSFSFAVFMNYQNKIKDEIKIYENKLPDPDFLPAFPHSFLFFSSSFLAFPCPLSFLPFPLFLFLFSLPSLPFLRRFSYFPSPLFISSSSLFFPFFPFLSSLSFLPFFLFHSFFLPFSYFTFSPFPFLFMFLSSSCFCSFPPTKLRNKKMVGMKL